MPVSSSLMSPRVEFSLLSLEDLVVLGLSVGSGSLDGLVGSRNLSYRNSRCKNSVIRQEEKILDEEQVTSLLQQNAPTV